jgi:hypothetical protein
MPPSKISLHVTYLDDMQTIVKRALREKLVDPQRKCGPSIAGLASESGTQEVKSP